MITVTLLRSWNPVTLEEAAQELQASQGALSEIGADAGDAGGMISRGWTGATSERAAATIKSYVKQADDLAEAIAAARRTMLAAADALYEAKALLADAEMIARQNGMWFTPEGLATPGGAAALDLGAATTQVKDMVRRALTAATAADRQAAEALRTALAALPPVEADGADTSGTGGSGGSGKGSGAGTYGAGGAGGAGGAVPPAPAPVLPPGGGGMPSMTSADGLVDGPGAGTRVFTASVDGTREVGSMPADAPAHSGTGVGHAAAGGGGGGRGGMPMMAGGGMGMGAAAAGGAAARASGQYRMVSDGTTRGNNRDEREQRPAEQVEVIEDEVEVLEWDSADADDDW